MRISPEILDALQKAVSRFPNRNQFAIKVGVPQHTLVRWLDGISKSISDTNYEKLFPLIKPYLKNGYRLPWDSEEQIERYQASREHYGADVYSELKELEKIDRELESLKGRKLDENEECYKHSLEEDAKKIQSVIDAKTREARVKSISASLDPEHLAELYRKAKTPEELEKLDRISRHVSDAINDPGESAVPFPSTPDTIRNTPELRECIKDAMLREGVRDASELNRRAGYDSSHSLERLLAGKLNWFPDVLSAVLDALNIKHDDAPMSPAERGMLAPDGMYNAGGVLTRPIPVVDWANAATHIASLVGRNGEPVMKKWDPENTDVALAPVGVRRNTQAFRVHGVSMEPTISDGDILFCEEQYDLNSIPSGKIVIVCFSDDSEYAGTVVCKRLRRAGSILMLTSDNEKTGKDITVNTPGEIAWIGIVVRKSCEL